MPKVVPWIAPYIIPLEGVWTITHIGSSIDRIYRGWKETKKEERERERETKLLGFWFLVLVVLEGEHGREDKFLNRKP